MCRELHLGEVARAKVRLELVEPNPLAHVQLLLAVLIMLVEPDEAVVERVPRPRPDQLTAGRRGASSTAVRLLLAIERWELGAAAWSRGTGKG